MFTVAVESVFSATHQLRLADGACEPLHGHDWRVRAVFARARLDDLGMVVDFELAQTRLDEVLAPLRYTNLSAHEAFTGMNATAEIVAKVIFDRLRANGLDVIHRVEVTEAPGCTAAYEPPTGAVQ